MKICQTNCGHHESSILDACKTAKAQGSSPKPQQNRPAVRGLPKQPVQPETKGDVAQSQPDLETAAKETEPELEKPTTPRTEPRPTPSQRPQRPPPQVKKQPSAHHVTGAGGKTAMAEQIKSSQSQKLPEPAVGEKIGTAKEAQEDVSQETKLLKAQVDMLKEAVKQAEVCYQMGRDVAKEAAKDSIKFEEDIKSEERGKDSIFPNVYVSIFDKNPNFVTDTLDPTKMDQQSFVFHLKEQRKTIGVNLADMLKEILSWKDASKIEKYKKDISGDLRALSSFCNAPTLILRQAIKHKQEQLRDKSSEKSPNFFSRAKKNKVTGNYR